MLPEHYTTAKEAGVTDIAVVAINPERKIRDDWSVEVTKELALKLLHHLPEFSYVFNGSKTKSSRPDIVSEAISRIILPRLNENGHPLVKDISFAKLCWENLSDALKSIGCTDVEVDELGSECDQDSLEFHAKHGTLMVPSNNFKAFRQRIARMAEN